MRKSTILKISVGLLVLLLTATCASMLYFINVLDISKQAPYLLSENQKQTDYYLISYADLKDVFYKNRNMLAASAVNKGFDFVFNYRREHIEPEYIAKHPILQDQRGAGYWLWKPYLILKTLNSIPDGAIVLYADSGMFIRKPLREFLEAGLSDKDVLLFSYEPTLFGKAARSATGDVFVALNCHEDRCRYGHHVWAGIVAVRNSPASRKFIAQWLAYCEQPELLTGSKNDIANYPEFSHHQHDEGILSVLGARESDVVNYIPIDKHFDQYINKHWRKSADRSLITLIHPDKQSKRLSKLATKTYEFTNKVRNKIAKKD